jgi:uracil-DNA glycosylase
LLAEVRACQICADLPHGPRPVLQASPHARILIAGQAPGRKVHESGTPFDDQSGARLRQWMGIGPEVFYDPTEIAILPMGFCYPGAGKAGDLAPRPECAPHWRQRLLAGLPAIQLTLVMGRHAQHYHVPDNPHADLTATVRAWREFWPRVLPLPHPSPRNNIWLRKNPWFEEQLLPELRRAVRTILSDGA